MASGKFFPFFKILRERNLIYAIYNNTNVDKLIANELFLLAFPKRFWRRNPARVYKWT